MLPYPDIDPVAIALGPLKLHWYGLTYLAGLAFAWWLAVRQTRRPGSVLQREQVDDLKTEMLVHLKTTLKNAGLQLQVEMKETPADEKKAFLSDREWYDMMVEKNPQLDKLRQALDLDLG
mgnify:CR=1 FL=1